MQMSQESWRLSQSGLFAFGKALRLDIGHDPGRATPIGGYNFPIWQAINFTTEALTLAGRLQQALVATEPVRVTLAVEHIQGWALVGDDPSRTGLMGDYRFGQSSWRREFDLSADAAATGARETAIGYAVDLLQRFGWLGATREIVGMYQRDTFG